MANIINRQQTFSTNGTVTAAGLHNLIDTALVNSAIIKNQQEITTIGTADLLLIAPDSVDSSLAPRKVTVQNLFDDGLTAGTFTSFNLTGALTYGTATGNRTVSTSATITTGTIPNLTAGTTTSTAATITTGTIPTLTTGTTTSTNEVVTNGTITNLSATTSTFLGTITGSTNVINIGSGQIYKDASGNVGIGTSSNTGNSKLEVYGNSAAAHVGIRANNVASDGYGTLWLSNNGSNDGVIRGGASAASFANQLAILTSGTTPVTIVTNNTERLRVDSSGNVGIGIASPAAKLHVNGGAISSIRSDSTGTTINEYSQTINSSNNGTYLVQNLVYGNGFCVTAASPAVDSLYQIGTTSSAPIQFITNNTERLRIDSSGNCSIGTATALSTLHVHGNVTLSNTTTATSAGTGGLSKPATYAGYLTVSINGTSRKIPYYAT
jgi:hypothetical protein